MLKSFGNYFSIYNLDDLNYKEIRRKKKRTVYYVNFFPILK